MKWLSLYLLFITIIIIIIIYNGIAPYVTVLQSNYNKVLSSVLFSQRNGDAGEHETL